MVRSHAVTHAQQPREAAHLANRGHAVGELKQMIGVGLESMDVCVDQSGDQKLAAGVHAHDVLRYGQAAADGGNASAAHEDGLVLENARPAGHRNHVDSDECRIDGLPFRLGMDQALDLELVEEEPPSLRGGVRCGGQDENRKEEPEGSGHPGNSTPSSSAKTESA
jgi:hypothetical protein